MYITHVPLDDFERIVQYVSRTRYSSNVETEWPQDLNGKRYPRIRSGLRTVTCKDGKALALGARYIGTGRDGRRKRWPKACWHVVRDVLGTMFATHPDAVCRTAMADYRGRDDFMQKFPHTYSGPLRAKPMYNLWDIGDMCNCEPRPILALNLNFTIQEVPY